jgi:hypothetical protein
MPICVACYKKKEGYYNYNLREGYWNQSKDMICAECSLKSEDIIGHQCNNIYKWGKIDQKFFVEIEENIKNKMLVNMDLIKYFDKKIYDENKKCIFVRHPIILDAQPFTICCMYQKNNHYFHNLYLYLSKIRKI